MELLTAGGDGIMDMVMMGIAGFFAATLALGVMWGFLRGAKRSGIRLITSLIGCVLALLVTPIMSMMLLGADLPVIGKPDAFMGDMLSGQTAAVPTQMMGMVGELIMGLAIVLVNLIMFFLMYFAFKWVSWIVYAVLASMFAPTKAPKADRVAALQGGQKSPNPKCYRLAGAGIGLVNGLILFGFLMIPVFGGFAAFDKVASYNAHTFSSNNVHVSQEVSTSNANTPSRMAMEVQRAAGSSSGMAPIFAGMKSANSQIQSSLMGKIAGMTGISFLGQMGTGYLTDVKTKSFNFNVVDLVVDGGITAIDTMALVDEFTAGGNPLDRIADWSEADYSMVQRFVNRIFGIKIIDNVLSKDNMEDISDGLKDKNVFKAADGVYKEESEQGAMYDALKMFNARTLSHDINSLIEIAKIVFAKETVDGVKVNLYGDLKDIIDNSKKANFSWRDVCESIEGKLGKDVVVNGITKKVDGEVVKDPKYWEKKNSKLRRLTDTVFGTYLVQAIFDDANSLSSLYKAPLEKFLPTEEGESEIAIANKGTAWLGNNSVSANSAELISQILSVAGVLADVATGGDNILASIAAMSVDDVDAMSSVLSTLTDSAGIGTQIRKLITKSLPADMKNIGTPDAQGKYTMPSTYKPTGVSYADKLIFDIVVKLNNTEVDPVTNKLDPMGWESLLRTAHSLAKMADGIMNSGEDFDMSNMSIEKILDLLKDSDVLENMLNIIGESEVLQEIIHDLIDDMVTEIASQFGGDSNSFTFEIGDDALMDFLEVLADGVTSMTTVIENLQDMDFQNFDWDNGTDGLFEALGLIDSEGNMEDNLLFSLINLIDLDENGAPIPGGTNIQIDILSMFGGENDSPLDSTAVGLIGTAIDDIFGDDEDFAAKFKYFLGLGN